MNDKTVVKYKDDKDDDRSSSSKPCFIMVEGDYLGEIYLLEREMTLIGRGDEADIVISDSGVSRRHASVEKTIDGFFIADLGSTNGVQINGKGAKKQLLTDGDKIRLGDVVLRFCFQDAIDVEYHEKLRSMAIRDGLTRLFNKRHFMEVLDREFKYSTRHGRGITLVMLDIDYFKKINDTHGHLAGDYCLRALSQLLLNEVRGYDVIARYGGEEIVFLLRETELPQAAQFGERVRELVEKYEFNFEGNKLQVTVSIGLAILSPERTFATPEDLIGSADKYLYEAKQAGRNCVRFAKSKESDKQK